MATNARDNLELKRRVDDFLVSDTRGIEASDFINHLQRIGTVGIFGGLLRDITLAGREAFSSDIDLVVDANPEELAEMLTRRNAARNRFGGFRLQGQQVQFDVWALPDTWAIKNGFVVATGLDALTKTTFFDWDAAVYVPTERILYSSEDYFDRIASGVVDINLRDNPNTLGAVARTLRLMIDWRAGLSDHLAEFLWRKIDEHNSIEIVEAQKFTLGYVPLKRQSIRKLHRELRARDFFQKSFRYGRKR